MAMRRAARRHCAPRRIAAGDGFARAHRAVDQDQGHRRARFSRARARAGAERECVRGTNAVRHERLARRGVDARESIDVA